MKLTHTSIRESVLTVMLIVVFVIVGLYSYSKITIDLFPRIDFPILTITAIYPGAGPSEVESQVTEKIEDELSTVSNVKSIDSTSMENVSLITVEFEMGVDIDIASIEVKDKVDAIISDLPEDLEVPKILKYDINALPIMNLSVSADRPLNEVYEIADKMIKDRLNRIDGIATIKIVGGLVREIQVDISKEALNHYDLTITSVAAIIGIENRNVPIGRLLKSDEEYSLRVEGENTSIKELSEMVIATPSGATVNLSDIATIVDGFEDKRESTRFQKIPSVAVIIYKRSDANTVKVASEVFSTIDQLKEILPESYNIGMARDLSAYIVDSVEDVLINIIIGIIITSFFLYIFLNDFRSTIIVSLSMPTSIIATFILIYFAGFTINVITLMALGISIGILATNSIIILENISRYINDGYPSIEAAEKGTSEIAMAVIASTLTNIVVFTPIAYMSGLVGQFFKQFGLTVVFATIFSLLVSFTMTPMLASKLLGNQKKNVSKKVDKFNFINRINKLKKIFFDKWEFYYDKTVEQYKRILIWCLDSPRKTILATFCILIISFVLISMVGGEFFPYSDQGYIGINVELSPGTRIEETEKIIEEIEDIIGEYSEVKTLFATIGGENKGVNEGELVIALVDLSERKMTAKEFVNKLRLPLAVIPEAEITISELSQGGRSEADISVEVTGPKMDTLTEIAEEVKTLLIEMEGLVDVDTSKKAPSPLVRFIPDRFTISNYGINLGNIYSILRTYYEGVEASVFREDGEEYNIKVRLNEKSRSSEDTFEEILIKTPKGKIPLSQLGKIISGRGESEILRKNRQRLIKVEANIGTGKVGEYESLITKATEKIDLPKGYSIDLGGQSERKTEAFRSLFEAMFMAIILTYIVLAAILRSYVHPITIMLTLPLGLIGTAVGLFVSGQTINMFSLMAMVMLVGIVVNNAILILDYTSLLRDEGMMLREALLKACPIRFRPILMTNLTIAFAILPQALGGPKAGFRVTMAVVTIGGVIFSAVFTLFLIPVVYEYLDRFTIRGKFEKSS